MASQRLTLQPFHWEEEDRDDYVEIRAWCLDPDSHPVLIRIEDFRPYCWIMLPRLGPSGPIMWHDNNIHVFANWLRQALCGGDIIQQRELRIERHQKKELYYYQGDKTRPMLRVEFKTLEKQRHCCNLLARARTVGSLGPLLYKVYEAKIKLYRKLLTQRGLECSQWLSIDGLEVPSDEHVSTLEREYVGLSSSLEPVEPDQARNYHAYPGVMAFDIECYSTNHRMFPNRLAARHDAYMISCIYQRINHPETRRNYCITLTACHPIEGAEVITVATEKELVDEFARLIRELDPDVITGYNILDFDIPYLDARLTRRMNTWPQMGRLLDRTPTFTTTSWSSAAYGRQNIGRLHVDGRIFIDMLIVARRDFNRLPRYDLNTVSHFILGRGKHDVTAKQMFEIYEAWLALAGHLDTPEADSVLAQMARVVRYCLEDSALTIDLMERINAWTAFVETSNVVGIPIYDLYTRGQQIRCLSLVYNQATRQGYVVTDRNVKGTSFKGGFVDEPRRGLWDFVIVLDFKSLYPSIIRAKNICFTTFIPPERDDTIPDDQCRIVAWTSDLGAKHEDQVIREYRYRFIDQPIGLLPQIVKRLVDTRNQVKKELAVETDPVMKITLKKREEAYKVTANSVFGFLGVEEGILPFKEGAMAITAYGRELTQSANKYLEERYGATIIYGDTDSTMFKLPFVTSYPEAIAWGKRLEKEISDLFPDPLQMEFEKAGRILCIEKKKYAMWIADMKTGEFFTKNGHPDFLVKGIILARRDNCRWQRQIYADVLEQIMTRQPLLAALDYIQEQILQLCRHCVPLEDLIIVKALGDNYASENFSMKIFADELRRVGRPQMPGSRLDYVVVRDRQNRANLGYRMREPETYREQLGTDNAEPIDVIYYIDNLLKNAIEQLIQRGYGPEITERIEQRQARDQRRFLDGARLLGYDLGDFGSDQGQIDILLHVTRNRLTPLKKRYLTRRGRLDVFIDDQPVKRLVSLIKQRELINLDIRKRLTA